MAFNEIDPQLRAQFVSLRDSWKNETAHISSASEIVNNKNYQQIIGLGSNVLPLLFEELQTDPDWWFYALREITSENPVNKDDWGNLRKMTISWLAWWEENK